MRIGTCVWLYNDEYLVSDCVKAIAEVFDRVEVYDLGSKDTSVEKVKSLGVKVNLLGEKAKVGRKEFIEMKREINAKYDYVFNIDADEIYPKKSLMFLKELITTRVPPRIKGYWRMLKKKEDRLLVSSRYECGEIAWNPKVFEIRKIWPNESLYPITHVSKRVWRQMSVGPYEELFCWHGVLLNRSSCGDDKIRSSKRFNREGQFGSLEWKEEQFLPWDSLNSNLLELI